MDLVMFDAQRQGRLSFYMVCPQPGGSLGSVCSGSGADATERQVSAGEEGIAVGSASALAPEDVIFAQYREAGVFQQRGFTLDEFMNQLFANRHDEGKGRNMPVHYGSRRLNIVRLSAAYLHCVCVGQGLISMLDYFLAHHLISSSDTNPSSSRRGVRAETPVTI